MRKTNTFIKEGAILALITIPFFVWLFKRYMFLDFWYDEIFSFDNFVFVPLKKTITDYGAPNNHIFFNLLNNIYVKLLGVKDLFSLMDAPYKIRLLPLAYATIALGYIYGIGKRFFNRVVAYLVLIVLVTTVPFYNFAVQIRGYSLSMTLVTMVLYYVWNFEYTLRWRDAICIVLLAVLILYTIPSNVYFLASVAVFYFFAGLSRIWKTPTGNIKRVLLSLLQWNWSEENKHFAIVLLIGIAIIITLCIYLPFYENFIDNRHFKSHGMFSNPDTLFTMMPETFMYFLSKRYLFVAMIVISVFSGFIPRIRRKNQEIVSRCLFCVIALCTPFIFSFIRGDQPPSRIFVNLVPLSALFVALVTFLFLNLFKSKIRLGSSLITGSIILYCHLTFAYNINHIEHRLKSDIEQGKNTYNIYYNYYQAYYRPMNLVRDFVQNFYTKTIPVTLILNSEEYEIRRYLDKFQVKYYLHPYEILFNVQGQAFVVTGFVRDVTARLSGILPEFKCDVLNKELNYHKILYCESAFIRDRELQGNNLPKFFPGAQTHGLKLKYAQTYSNIEK